MRSHLRISLFLLTLLVVFRSAHATTFPPIANNDVAGLINTIAMANANGQDDTIDLAANGTYILTARDNALNGLPAIAADGGHKLTINGHGATIMRSTAGGTPTFRIFYVNSGANLTLDSLILSNGSPGAFHGGAIYNDGELGNVSLTITNCTLSGNSGDYGGAIFNDGYQDPSVPAHTATLTVSNSTFSGNVGTQYGGAIWNESGGIAMNVSYSTFSMNSATARSAGAIQFDGSGGTATGSITSSTFTQNTAANYGGGVNIDGSNSGNATLTISDCTFDRNQANWGGGVAMDGSTGNAVVTVRNCTFNRNFSFNLGDAIYLSQTGAGITSLPIGNTILASADPDFNISIDNFSGGTAGVTSQGHNLSDDAAGGDATTGPGGFLNHSGDIRNTDPLLASAGLQNNGGPTQTIALQGGSPAINQGDDSIAPERDQRGYSRTGVSDIGAFEAGGLINPIVTGSSKTHGAAGAFAINLPLTGAVGVECRSGGPNGDYQMAMSFASPVTLSGATLQNGVGTVTGFTVSGSQVTVSLTGVTNAQRLNVKLSNVSDGVTTRDVNIPMGVLAGDTTGNGVVNASDIAQTQSQSGHAVTANNFREDVTLNGSINSSDIGFVQAQSGTGLPMSQPLRRLPSKKVKREPLPDSH